MGIFEDVESGVRSYLPTMANAVRSGEGQLVLRHRWTGVSGFLRGRRRAQLRPQQPPAEADTARVSESRPRRPLAGHVHRCQRRVPHRAQRARTAASRSPLEGVMRRINLFKADLQGGGIERRRSSLRCPPIASGTVPDLVPDIPGLGPEGAIWRARRALSPAPRRNRDRTAYPRDA